MKRQAMSKLGHDRKPKSFRAPMVDKKTKTLLALGALLLLGYFVYLHMPMREYEIELNDMGEVSFVSKDTMLNQTYQHGVFPDNITLSNANKYLIKIPEMSEYQIKVTPFEIDGSKPHYGAPLSELVFYTWGFNFELYKDGQKIDGCSVNLHVEPAEKTTLLAGQMGGSRWRGTTKEYLPFEIQGVVVPNDFCSTPNLMVYGIVLPDITEAEQEKFSSFEEYVRWMFTNPDKVPYSWQGVVAFNE